MNELVKQLSGISSVLAQVRSQLSSPKMGLPSGIEALDAKTAGFHPEELTILGGFPGAGKSALMGSIVLNLIPKHRVLVCSLELSLHMLVKRLICTLAKVTYADLCYRGLSEEGQLQRDTAIATLQKHGPRLLLHGDSLTTVDLSRLIATHKPEIVFIDRMEYVQPSKFGLSEYAARDLVCQELRTLAIRHQIPVVALAQLNLDLKEVAENPGKIAFTEFRGSKGIKQFAQVCLLINRPSYYNKDKEDTSATIFVAKNNNGSEGSCPCAYEGKFFWFRDVTETETAKEWAEPKAEKEEW